MKLPFYGYRDSLDSDTRGLDSRELSYDTILAALESPIGVLDSILPSCTL